MNYFLAIIAGAVQGVTEFLPISSSAHLLFFHEFLNFNLPDNLTFDVALHLGTLLAIVVFFWTDIIKLAKGFFRSLVKFDFKNDFDQRLAWLIIIGSIPAIIAGYFGNDLIDLYFHEGRGAIIVSAIMLLVVALLMLAIEKIAKQTKVLEQLTVKNSLWCGVAQAIALIPGTSRSGITIIAGLSQKLNREAAARFSFLLSLPVVAGAAAKKIIDSFGGAIDWPLMLCGLLSSLVVGYLSLKFLLKYLSNHSLNIFAYYRIALAIALLAWLFAR